MDILAESSDVSVLDLLRRLGPQRISQLATAMGVTVTAVRQRLNRLTAKGFGESQPVADNANALGRAQNRRIAITMNEQKP